MYTSGECLEEHDSLIVVRQDGKREKGRTLDMAIWNRQRNNVWWKSCPQGDGNVTTIDAPPLLSATPGKTLSH